MEGHDPWKKHTAARDRRGNWRVGYDGSADFGGVVILRLACKWFKINTEMVQAAISVIVLVAVIWLQKQNE